MTERLGATTRRRALAADTFLRSADLALHAYADRGVFRGFSAADEPRAVRQYRFSWLARRPMLVRVARGTRTLAFVGLFPAVRDTPGVLDALRSELRDRCTAAVPAHRRIDRRRARLVATVRDGALSVNLTSKGQDGAYAVRAALGLVNDLFMLLHERYPEYLVAHFGFKDE